MVSRIAKLITLWFIGAFTYGLIELTARGYTHISMGILGGLCFVIIGELNHNKNSNMPLILQMFISSVIITSLEFITGIIVNVWLCLDVWDYSCFKTNIMGQICLPFSLIWFFLSVPAIFLEDYSRHILFGEEKRHYQIFFKHSKKHAM